MDSYLEFLSEEEGRTILDIGVGFIAYTLGGGELYLSHIYLKKEFRGGRHILKLKDAFLKLCKESEANVATATIFLNADNRHSFLRKLNLFQKVGFEPNNMAGQAIVLIKQIKE